MENHLKPVSQDLRDDFEDDIPEANRSEIRYRTRGCFFRNEGNMCDINIFVQLRAIEEL